MSTAPAQVHVGDLLREWRHRRRLSQLALASAAEVSTRHLSFVERGRSKPSRELLLHLAKHLEIPPQHRNDLLLAGGYAPLYRPPPGQQRPGGTHDEFALLVRSHDPYPAWAADREWNLIAANLSATALLTHSIPTHVLEPRPNPLRIALHPQGLAARIENLAEWAGHILSRLDDQAVVTGDRGIRQLAAELRGYPGVPPASDPSTRRGPLLPRLKVQVSGRRLQFFDVIANLASTYFTTTEAIFESLLPADPYTAAALRTREPNRAPEQATGQPTSLTRVCRPNWMS
jgi:transcriptional regulator with XRE-family HTH domain